MASTARKIKIAASSNVVSILALTFIGGWSFGTAVLFSLVAHGFSWGLTGLIKSASRAKNSRNFAAFPQNPIADTPHWDKPYHVPRGWRHASVENLPTPETYLATHGAATPVQNPTQSIPSHATLVYSQIKPATPPSIACTPSPDSVLVSSHIIQANPFDSSPTYLPTANIRRSSSHLARSSLQNSVASSQPGNLVSTQIIPCTQNSAPPSSPGTLVSSTIRLCQEAPIKTERGELVSSRVVRRNLKQ